MQTADNRTIKWKAKSLPYCITHYSKAQGRYIPLGKKRYASIAEASAECERLSAQPGHRDFLLFVDFADAYAKAA